MIVQGLECANSSSKSFITLVVLSCLEKNIKYDMLMFIVHWSTSTVDYPRDKTVSAVDQMGLWRTII